MPRRRGADDRARDGFPSHRRASSGRLTAGSARIGPLAIERIVVFGGGFGAWLAALACARGSSPACETLVVETPAERTLGIGEAASAAFLPLLVWLGIDARAFLQRCSASPRLATRHDEWIGAGTHVWTPCTAEMLSPRTTHLLRHAARLHRTRGATSHFADVSPAVRLCRSGAVPSTRAQAALAHGFHFDADALTQLARETAAARGVRQLFGVVADVALDRTTGAIASVGIGGGREVEAGVFIDATANGAVVRAMGNEWIAWSDILCDCLVGLPLPRDPAAPSFTQTTAAVAGHLWRLPLVHRTGLGYSYSSAHTSDEAATEALVTAAGLARRRTADPRRLRFEPGRRVQVWRSNCLAVGAAACRLDPVFGPESHILQAGLEAWRDALEGESKTLSDRRATYNLRMDAALGAARDAVRLPFVTSARAEPFWDDARRAPHPASLGERLAAYSRIDTPDGAPISLAEACMLSASGRYPRAFTSPDAEDDLADSDSAFRLGVDMADQLVATWRDAR